MNGPGGKLTLPYPLYLVEEPLAALRPPEQPFDPNGAWQHTYRAYSIAAKSINTGVLTLQRRVPAEGRSALTVNYAKHLEGDYVHTLEAEIECRADALATPVKWTFGTLTTDAAGKPLAETRLAKSGAAEGETLSVAAGERTHALPVSGDYTSNWCLFDAVQRLPRKSGEVYRFSLLDDFDQAKRNHELWYSRSGTITVGGAARPNEEPAVVNSGEGGGRELRLHAFQHVGDGISPTTYWVDETGRLLFVVAGLEGWFIESADA